MPLPPVIGPLSRAAGPGGAATRVEGVDGVDGVDGVADGAVVDAVGSDDFDDDEHPAIAMAAATAAPSMT